MPFGACGQCRRYYVLEVEVGPGSGPVCPACGSPLRPCDRGEVLELLEEIQAPPKGEEPGPAALRAGWG